ncbi:Uncharacterised protein [Achromobacter ruhlandii]|nr:Uncharacterised protein [Achromobacter ruhlandii]CUJ69526.1 Uncharacterised protein [Achromobacter ruhlandii]CUK19527.1 Uncharacterised protein [Achromobacter ruhlandii]
MNKGLHQPLRVYAMCVLFKADSMHSLCIQARDEPRDILCVQRLDENLLAPANLRDQPPGCVRVGRSCPKVQLPPCLDQIRKRVRAQQASVLGQGRSMKSVERGGMSQYPILSARAQPFDEPGQQAGQIRRPDRQGAVAAQQPLWGLPDHARQRDWQATVDADQTCIAVRRSTARRQCIDQRDLATGAIQGERDTGAHNARADDKHRIGSGRRGHVRA